jgi:hypothetical protein
MTDFINRLEDVSPQQRVEIVDGLVVLVRWLIRQRTEKHLHQLSAQLMTADGPVTLTCSADDHVYLIRPGGQPLDITSLVR